MSDVPIRPTRLVVVLGATLISTSPLSVFLFLMALVVSEYVIYPTATMATALISALMAGWATNLLAGDGRRTILSAVLIRNAVCAIPLAVASIFIAGSLSRPIWLIAIVIAYCGVTATVFAVRHRTAEAYTAGDGGYTLGWLLGIAVGVGLIIFVASLAGLAGA